MKLRGDKQGSEKYYIIISLILGIMVLALALYFIFHEYFTEETLDWEACRQSVVMRGNLPEISKGGIRWATFKDKFPLKCKTEVIYIDENTEDVKQVIEDTIRSCWNLFSEGKLKIFPSDKLGFESFCVPCARIHFDPAVVDKYTGDKKIDMKVIYDKLFPDFKPFYADYFYVDDSSLDFSSWSFSLVTGETLASKIVYPRYVDSKKGDLVYYFEQITASSDTKAYSYGFYFQQDQVEKDPYDELKKMSWFGGPYSAHVCDQFDGIPA
tara:strand:+ start:1889 stop:2692 length:804 start_codon:yes stop_codon:yes gene_type:complete